MKAQDVTATLDLALAASGLDQMTVVRRPRLLSDNGASYVAEDPRGVAEQAENRARPQRPLRSTDTFAVGRRRGRSTFGRDCRLGPSAGPPTISGACFRSPTSVATTGRSALARRWVTLIRETATTSRKRLSFGTGSCSSNGSRRTCSRSVYSTASYTSSTNRCSIGIGTAARPGSIGANTRSASPSRAKKKGRVLRDPP